MVGDRNGQAAAPLVEAALGDVPVTGVELLLAMLRSIGVVVATLLAYALMPIEGQTAATAVTISALVGLVGIAVVFMRQVMKIARARRPTLAAVEALLLVFGMFLALFAFLYVSVSAGNPAAFSSPVDKVAGVYFSVTVLATVGFGDITPVTDLARVLVTLQMVLDLLLIGTAVKILGMSARRAVTAHRAGAGRDGAATAGPLP